MGLTPLFDASSFSEEAVTEQTLSFNETLSKLRVGLLNVPPNAVTLRTRFADFAQKATGNQIYVSPCATTELVRDGTQERLFRLLLPPNPIGVVIYIHGGGWVMGAPDAQDARLEVLVKDGFAVVAPRYRLAPEHPFPAGLDDCEAAIRWTCARFPQFALAVLGESAGATLAVAAALRVRDRPAKAKIAALALLYGIYDLTMTPSQLCHGDLQGLLGTSLMAWFIDQYVDLPLRRDPLVSPLYADLEDLPPALFVAGTRDLLLDDSLFLHARWSARGRPSELHIAPGGVHAFNHYPLDISAEANRSIAAFLRKYVAAGKSA